MFQQPAYARTGSETPDPYDATEFPAESVASFATISLVLMRLAVREPHVRLLLVLARHAAMRGKTTFKMRWKMWAEAGIRDSSERRRAVNRLEGLGVARVQRCRGRSPILTVRTDRHGRLTTWRISETPWEPKE